MVYYTGDIHGNPIRIRNFCDLMTLTNTDIIVLLGDTGANYYGSNRDKRFKYALNSLGPIIFSIHGNHEQRPANISSYKTKKWNGGLVWYEDEFSNVLFAKDGEVYTMDNLNHLVIGGAYSVDKYYRLEKGYSWWADEQPSDEVKVYIEAEIQKNKHIDVVLSHTCPYKYIPIESFLPMVDRSTVDNSTEKWLDRIEEAIEYNAWFAGHWHINKRINKMHFLFDSFECSEDIKIEAAAQRILSEHKRTFLELGK